MDLRTELDYLSAFDTILEKNERDYGSCLMREQGESKRERERRTLKPDLGETNSDDK